ncbi:hypothetical protein OSTOST_26017 [Ostertagia ostertagi]
MATEQPVADDVKSTEQKLHLFVSKTAILEGDRLAVTPKSVCDAEMTLRLSKLEKLSWAQGERRTAAVVVWKLAYSNPYRPVGLRTQLGRRPPVQADEKEMEDGPMRTRRLCVPRRRCWLHHLPHPINSRPHRTCPLQACRFATNRP